MKTIKKDCQYYEDKGCSYNLHKNRDTLEECECDGCENYKKGEIKMKLKLGESKVDLRYCEKCIQMTNHRLTKTPLSILPECLKCEAKEREKEIKTEKIAVRITERLKTARQNGIKEGLAQARKGRYWIKLIEQGKEIGRKEAIKNILDEMKNSHLSWEGMITYLKQEIKKSNHNREVKNNGKRKS